MEYFFSKILKSGICPWFEEWSYFPWTFRFIWNELYLHFVETKNLRVDSSGDLDFPQLENSLQVKPFLLTPISLTRHKKTQIQKLTHTLCHHLYPSHLCRASHVTLKSLRSLRCRLELGKNTVNSNSTTGLFVSIFSFLRQRSLLQTNCESEEQPSSLEIATWLSSSSPQWSCSSCATCQESSPGWCSSHYCGHHHRHHGQQHIHQLNLQHLWGGEHPLHPRLQGKRFTLNSRFNKEHEKHHDSYLYLKNIVQFYHCREGQDPNLVHVHHQRCSTPHGGWPRLFTIHVTNSKFWYSIVIWKR